MRCRDGGGTVGAGTSPQHPIAPQSRSLHGCRGSGAALQVGCFKPGCLWPLGVFRHVLVKETSLQPEDEHWRSQASPSLFQGCPSSAVCPPGERRTSGQWVMVREPVIMSLPPKRSFLLCFSLE